MVMDVEWCGDVWRWQRWDTTLWTGRSAKGISDDQRNSVDMTTSTITSTTNCSTIEAGSVNLNPNIPDSQQPYYYLLLSHLTVLLKDACCIHLSRCLSHTEHTVIEKHRFEVLYRWSLINPIVTFFFFTIFLLQCVLGHSALLPYRQQGHHHGHHNGHVFFIRILWRQQSHPQSLHGSWKLDWTWHGNLGISYSNCKVYPCIMTCRNGTLNKMKVWVSISLNGNIFPFADTVSVCISMIYRASHYYWNIFQWHVLNRNYGRFDHGWGKGDQTTKPAGQPGFWAAWLHPRLVLDRREKPWFLVTTI